MITNFTNLSVSGVLVYKYDVSFEPEMNTAQERRRVLEELAAPLQSLLGGIASGWAYDGDKVFYCVGRLGTSPVELRRSGPVWSSGPDAAPQPPALPTAGARLRELPRRA